MASMIPVIALVEERGGSDWLVGLVLTGVGVGGVLGALVAPGVHATPGRLLVAVRFLFGASDRAMALPFGAVCAARAHRDRRAVDQRVGDRGLHGTGARRPHGRMDAVPNFATRALTPLAPVLGMFGADLVGGAVALLAAAR
jgi:hypothetical protein